MLEEPYSYDGAFAGTGHVAVYLSNVCAASPVELRRCAKGETGVVLSRYDGVAGYDWLAIPLIPYLYAVDRPESVPLFADPKMAAFLRDQYRREYLQQLVPDLPDGKAPDGNWYELIGSAYDRTLYGFEIETSPAQDALLIKKLNAAPNRESYHFMKRNCADFVREVVNFYYPHALHRSVIGDLGVTTPKQVAKMLAKYSHKHPDLESSTFIVPQVPGTIRRSKPIRGVLESVVAAKKYMIPLVMLHPYIGGGLLVGYFGHRRFDPAKDALVLDSRRQLDSAVTRSDRIDYQSRLDALIQADSDPSNDGKTWEHLQENAEPALDASRRPVVEITVDDNLTQVGISHGNILSNPESLGLAANLVQARLRQELRSSTALKTARSDIERDFALLEQLTSRQAEIAAARSAASSTQRTIGSQ